MTQFNTVNANAFSPGPRSKPCEAHIKLILTCFIIKKYFYNDDEIASSNV